MDANVLEKPQSDIHAILAKFDEEIDKRKYTNHSWTKLVLSDDVTREGLKEWAIQKYHQTFLQIPIFAILHYRAADNEPIRKFMVEQLIDEESDLQSGGDSHYGLMRRFALAMGATDAEIDASKPAPAVQRYVDSIIKICKEEHPVAVLTAMYAGESQTSEVITMVLKKFKERYGLSDYDLEWFEVHAGDDAHADAERELMASEGAKVPDLEEAGIRVIDTFMTEWGLLQDYYYSITSKA